MRQLSSSDEVKLTDCAQALDDYQYEHKTIALPEGSWGEGGHHYVWANQQVAWMWDVIYPLEDRFLNVLKRHIAPEFDGGSGENAGGTNLGESDILKTILDQAGRELLLLESSDWQFVIS